MDGIVGGADDGRDEVALARRAADRVRELAGAAVDRVGGGGELRNLYAQLGNVLRAKRPGWSLAMISADKALEAQVKLTFSEGLKFKNGGIPVRLVVAGIPSRG